MKFPLKDSFDVHHSDLSRYVPDRTVHTLMKINIRENGKGNQELLDNPEKLATLDTRNRTKNKQNKNHNTICGFLRFPPPKKLSHDITEILLKVALNTIIP